MTVIKLFHFKPVSGTFTPENSNFWELLPHTNQTLGGLFSKTPTLEELFPQKSKFLGTHFFRNLTFW
jgi:hypothetical protein